MNYQYLLFLNLRNVLDEQFSIINAAHNLGYKIILLDKNTPQNSLLMPYIDLLIAREKTETEIIKQVMLLSEKHIIKGVFSWNDPDVDLASVLASQIKVPSVNINSAHLARNKFAMRSLVHKSLPELVPQFVLINSLDDINNSEIKYPAVLKPISASGSKGIFKINNKREAIFAYNNLLKLSENPYDGLTYSKYGKVFILEEFLLGQEFSVEGVVVKNQLYIAGVTDKLTTDDWHLEYRHIFPANYEKKVLDKIEESTRQIVKALNLNNCIIHLEGKWHDNQFKLVEIAARCGGDLISTHLISQSLGFNWLEFAMSAIINQDIPNVIESPFFFKKVSGIQFKLAKQELEFKGFKIKEGFYKIPSIISVKEIVSHNKQILLPPHDFALQRLGYVIASDQEFKNVANNLNLAINLLEI